jgi:xanthosine utilization system XapX-like protein
VDSHSVFQALQLAVSPVILISAYGLLLLSMTNRLGRAIDRARLLVREGAAKEDQITIITQRAGWIRSAIVFTSLALIAAGLLVLVLFASIYLPFNIAPVVAVLFIGSLVSVVVGLGYFIADIYGSLHAMQAELQEASRSKVADRS